MKIGEFARKSGIMRYGATAGTYKNSKDMPSELMMDDVYDAKKDLINSKKEGAETQPPTSDGNDQQPPTEASKPTSESPKPKPKWLKPVLIATGSLFGLILLIAIFGTPSAERVFNDSLDTMLQTESVTIEQEFSGKAGGEAISLESTTYLNMADDEDLKAKGTFTLSMTTDAIPLAAKAEFVSVDGGKYIKFDGLSSNNSTYGSAFREIEDSIKDKWIKSRDGDNFASLVDLPIDAATDVTALPYANIGDDKRKEIVALLTDEDAFEIKESARVTVNGQSAYRYELEFDEDTQGKVSDLIGEEIAYFEDDTDGDDDTTIDKLELWIDIATKRFIKMEYSGTSSQGDITAVTTFSGYGETVDVQRPDEYFVESELTQ